MKKRTQNQRSPRAALKQTGGRQNHHLKPDPDFISYMESEIEESDEFETMSESAPPDVRRICQETYDAFASNLRQTLSEFEELFRVKLDPEIRELFIKYRFAENCLEWPDSYLNRFTVEKRRYNEAVAAIVAECNDERRKALESCMIASRAGNDSSADNPISVIGNPNN